MHPQYPFGWNEISLRVVISIISYLSPYISAILLHTFSFSISFIILQFFSVDYFDDVGSGDVLEHLTIVLACLESQSRPYIFARMEHGLRQVTKGCLFSTPPSAFSLRTVNISPQLTTFIKFFILFVVSFNKYYRELKMPADSILESTGKGTAILNCLLGALRERVGGTL